MPKYLKDFSCFGPKVMAGIGSLPDTVTSRPIVMTMRRKTHAEKVERFRSREIESDASLIRISLERWASHNLNHLRTARPGLPDAMSDRQQDISEPLVAIADLAGGESPSRIRGALLELFGASSAGDSIGVRLLRNIYSVFEAKAVERITSCDLVAELREIEGQPWAEWHQGKAMSVGALARQLGKYGIQLRVIRFGSTTPRGYEKEAFVDAWSRYCSYSPPNKCNTATTRINTDVLLNSEPQQGQRCCTSEHRDNPHQSSNVAVFHLQRSGDGDGNCLAEAGVVA